MFDRLQFEWYDIERDPAGWDDSVNGAGQNVFHRAATLAAQQSGRAVRRGVVVKRFGARVCLVGGLIAPHGTGGLFTALSFPPASPRVAPDLPGRILEWLFYQGLTTVRIGCHDGGVEGYQIDPRTGRADERLEFVYDLSLDEAQRLHIAGAEHRRLLETSWCEPMRLRRIDRHQAWTMACAQAAWATRRDGRVAMFGVMRNYRYLRRLVLQMKHDGSGNLYGIHDRRGRMLAMAYMLERSGTAYYLTGANSDEGQRRGAAVRLFFELAQHYARLGIGFMNIGGVSAQAADTRHRDFGLYRFKSGFGAHPVLRRCFAAVV